VPKQTGKRTNTMWRNDACTRTSTDPHMPQDVPLALQPFPVIETQVKLSALLSCIVFIYSTKVYQFTLG
jgi:hypothetical protein